MIIQEITEEQALNMFTDILNERLRMRDEINSLREELKKTNAELFESKHNERQYKVEYEKAIQALASQYSHE